MKHLKLFFALFAMLALGVSNAWAEEYALYSGTITEGDYVIVYDGNAMNNTVSSSRLGYTAVTITGDKISNPDATIVWHIAPSGDYWTIFSANVNKYAASTGAKNKAQLLASGTDNKSLWTVSGSSTYEFVNKANAVANVNKNLRQNGTYGFACYATSTGGALSLYKKVEQSGGGETPEPDPDPTPDPEPEPDPTPDPGTGTTSEVTFIFDTDQGLSELGITKPNAGAGTNLGSNVYTKAPINMTATDGGTATRVWNSSGATTLRVYKSTGSLTFSSEATINKIVFNTSITATASVGTLSGTTWAGETKEVKFTFGANATIKTIAVSYVSSGGEPETPATELTNDQFAWSAATAEATMGASNTFPTLTNTLPVSVTYESSTPATATIAADGTITLVAPGTTTISAKFAGGEVSGTTYAPKTVTYALTVLKAPATPTSTVYVKVTSTAGITDGEYLIVYEEGKVAFNGALTDLDAVGNTIEVTINNNTIAGTNYIDAATFTIDVTNGTILSASGKYIGKTANSNGLDVKTTAMTNTFAIDANGNAVITGNTAALRYNKTADQKRFRYYKDGGGTQEKIALYKKASSHTLTYGTCTNGSVSADVADGATVLSGTTITLSNTPTTDYKLSAYDVYKTGEESTKVTVADDNTFIMPEFDVTISATFELAKTLTGIEITNAATQTTFWQGETFNYTGLEVTAHFDGAADEDVTDKVTVTGSTATAGTAVEVTVSFTEGTTTKTTEYDITVKATANTTETAYDVATAREIIDKVSSANDIYVQGIVSKIVTAYNSTYGNITYDISADGLTTSVQLQAYRGKSFNGDPFTSADDVKVGDEVVVFGKLLKYNSTYELAENNKLISLNRNKAVAGLAYETKEYTAKVNEAFSTPVLTNPNSLTVTYSSSDENLATVDATTGAVTILDKTGKVTITATFDGNAAYLPGTASYNITITDPNQLEATFVAADDKGNTTQGEGEIIKSPITFACSDGILGNGEEYRIYANAKAIFSAAEGYIITKVVLTSTASDDSKYGPAKLSTEDGTYTYSGKEGTWVGEAYTVTLTASAQTRATLITVYYKQDNRVDAGLAWNPATVSLTVGDAFTAPTFSNPNTLIVNFKSSNADLATVNNSGVISLVSGKTGTATITATFAGDATYKAAEVTCTIIVNHKSEDVVILAKCKDQYYAMVAEYVEGKNDVLQALPVEYVNGKIYNVEPEDQASIIWKRVVVNGKTTFKNGDNYLSAVNSAALKLATETCDWVFEGDMYKIEGSTRTILYYTSTGGFKNYATTNMSKDGVNGEYSSAAITVAPLFADGNAYHRTVTKDNFGTICIPFGSNVGKYTGAEFYEISWMEMDGATPKGIWLDQVNGALTAGKPYIFKATATELAVIGNGTTAGSPVTGVAGLTGTFTLIQDSETSGDASNKLEGNYMISGNQFLLCPAGCWLNANRAYIDASIIANHTTKKAVIPGRRRVCLGETSENEATGFENIVAPEGQAVKAIVNGQLIIIRDGVKYNVQGVRL